MHDVAFTDNSIPHAVQEVQSKKQLKQHLIIACWKCYNTVDISKLLIIYNLVFRRSRNE